MQPHSLDLFFLLLRVGLQTEVADGKALDSCFPADADKEEVWREMRAVACRQGVASVMLDGVQRLKDAGGLSGHFMPSRAELMQWVSHTSMVEANWRRHEAVVTKLSSFYAAHGMRMMVLKGHGLSTLYPTPSHRPCGDIDIWLYGEQERGDRLLRERGVAIDTDRHHHTIFTIDGVMVENHYEFLNLSTMRSNREIEGELHAALQRATADTKEGWTTPPANFNALFLLRHAAKHFSAMEITLRHVVDWAMFVRAAHEEIDWQWLIDIARRQNMDRFLSATNGICIDRLGLAAELFPTMERNKGLEERIVEDILNPKYEDKTALGGNALASIAYRMRRWWGQRWKHRLVYRESMPQMFLYTLRSHFTKPKGL